MKAKSIKGKTKAEIERALSDCMNDGYRPTLAIVFISIKINFMEIGQLLGEHNIQVLGATSNGEFIDEELGSESIAILLLDLPKEHFRIYFESYEDLQFREAGRKIAKKAKSEIDNPAFIISCSNSSTDAEEILRGFEEICGNGVNVFGGMAGDDLTFDKQYVFSNSQQSSQGMIALAIDAAIIEIKGYAVCGWKAMGTEKTVTRSEGNHLITIEDVPALDIIAKYGGIKDPSERNENLLLEMATMCPLQLQRVNAPPVMRPGLVVDWSDRSIYCSGTVPEGSKVKFCLPPDFDAIEEVIRGCQVLRDTEIPLADAMIYFTCAGRLLTFGPVMEEEIKGVQQVWDVPMAGMFSNAEIGKAKGGKLELHNLSTCCVVLKEK